MTREEKAVIIDELSQKFASTPYFYITNANGMTVSEVNTLRGLCFERGVEYRVVKNTLIKKALETLETDYSSFDEVLKGFSGVMFHPESGKVPAQLIKEFKKKSGNDKLKFKGASVDSSVFVGESQLDVLISPASHDSAVERSAHLLVHSPSESNLSYMAEGISFRSSLILDRLVDR